MKISLSCSVCLGRDICCVTNFRKYNDAACQKFHKLVEEKFTSTNTGSPKLPLDIVETVLEEIFGNRYAAGNGAEYVKQTITIIERQLRASA